MNFPHTQLGSTGPFQVGKILRIKGFQISRDDLKRLGESWGVEWRSCLSSCRVVFCQGFHPKNIWYPNGAITRFHLVPASFTQEEGYNSSYPFIGLISPGKGSVVFQKFSLKIQVWKTPKCFARNSHPQRNAKNLPRKNWEVLCTKGNWHISYPIVGDLGRWFASWDMWSFPKKVTQVAVTWRLGHIPWEIPHWWRPPLSEHPGGKTKFLRG